MQSFFARKHLAHWTLLACALSPAIACSSGDKPPASAPDSENAGAPSASSTAGKGSGGAGKPSAAGAATSADGGLGVATGGAGGERPEGPASSGGESAGAPSGGMPDVVMPGGPFIGPDPFPCTGDDGAPAPTYAAECSPTKAWNGADKVASDVAAGARLLGVTPDELTLIWSEPASSTTAYYVAERSAVDVAFGAKAELPVRDVIAISPDGRRLVALGDSASSLRVLSRPDRASAFGSDEEGEFALLNADAQAKGSSFSSCVFAPDDRTLYYTVGAFDERYPLHVSTRSGTGPWPVGTAIESCEFEEHSGYGRYPTAVSSDGKTLFFYDSWRGKGRAAWRAANSGPFTWFKDLGDLFVAQPNTACDRLYYSAPDPAASIVSASAG